MPESICSKSWQTGVHKIGNKALVFFIKNEKTGTGTRCTWETIIMVSLPQKLLSLPRKTVQRLVLESRTVTLL